MSSEIGVSSSGKGKSKLALYFIILLQQFLSALSFPIFKLGLNEVEPFTFAFFRFTLTALVFLPILLFYNFGEKIPLKIHLKIFVIGLIIIPFNQVAYLYGQSMTSAGHASLLFATIPIFIYIMAILFLNEKASWRKTIGIIIAAGGVYLILKGGSVDFGRDYLIGDIIILIAVMAWSLAAILIKPLATKYGAFRITGFALIYGAIVYFPFGLYRAVNFDVASISLSGWFSIAYVAIVVSIVAYVLWYYALKYMEASSLAITQNIQPILAVAVAAILLHEPIYLNFVIGGVIIILGIIITEV